MSRLCRAPSSRGPDEEFGQGHDGLGLTGSTAPSLCFEGL